MNGKRSYDGGLIQDADEADTEESGCKKEHDAQCRDILLDELRFVLRKAFGET